MFTMVVVVLLVLYLSWNIKSMIARYLNHECKGCSKDCSTCLTGTSLYEAYRQDHAK